MSCQHDTYKAPSCFGQGTGRRLLSPMANNAKTRKQLIEFGFEGVILYLTPGELCAWKTSGCLNACLGHSAGCMKWSNVQAAQKRRTDYFREDRAGFLAQVRYELRLLIARAEKKGLEPIARLNGTSDIPWETLGVIGEFSEITFYDYTKSRRRAEKSVTDASWPENYFLTQSATEYTTKRDVDRAISMGLNIAKTFGGQLPGQWMGYPVHDADSNDFRFRDFIGTIQGLLAKGAAKHDTSGFVRWIEG